MKTKKLIAFILSFCLTLTVVPTAWAAENSYTINGVTITPTSVVSSDSDLKNCASYATAVLKAIGKWTPGMTSYSSSYSILAGKSAEERKITADHVREFIQAASVGSRIRVCSVSDTTGNNCDQTLTGGNGHTMVLVEKMIRAVHLRSLKQLQGTMGNIMLEVNHIHINHLRKP